MAKLPGAEMTDNQPQELSDCNLCVEFAHCLSNFITLEKKKKANKSNTAALPTEL